MKVILCFSFVLILYFKSCQSKLYLTDTKMAKVIEYGEESCNVHTDKQTIKDLVEKEVENFALVDEQELDEIVRDCFVQTRFGFGGFQLIYPGTLWCGQGTRATNYTELGVHSQEDSCCRDHDNCPDSILAGQCKGGICNKSSYTRSHCECDRKFQQCLRGTGTETGNTIGAIFFNIVKMFCFEESPACDEEERFTLVEQGRSLSICPYTFLESQKYIFTSPFYTVKNRKAYYLNKLLRKLDFGK